MGQRDFASLLECQPRRIPERGGCIIRNSDECLSHSRGARIRGNQEKENRGLADRRIGRRNGQDAHDGREQTDNNLLHFESLRIWK